MDNDEITVTDFTGNFYNSDKEQADFYSETRVINVTGEEIYLCKADGSIYTVPTLSTTNNFIEPHLEIQIIYRSGRIDSSYGIFSTTPTYSKMRHPGISVKIPWSKLADGALFIECLGMSCSTRKYISELRQTNYLSSAYHERSRKELMQKFMSGSTVPVVVYGNTHNLQYKYLYLEVNNRLMSVILDHRQDQPESLTLTVNRGGRYDTYNITDIDWSNEKSHGVFNTVIDGYRWTFGTNRAAVQKKIADIYDEQISRRTDTEVEDIIRQKTADLSRQLENKEQQLAQVQRELEIVKKDLASTKIELDRANSSAHASYEQQVLAAKIAAQQLERDNLKEKQRLYEEQRRYEQERDRANFRYEQSINQAKIEKENLSVKSAQASTVATILKTLAVIAPLVVSAVMWVSTRSTKSCLMPASVINLTGCLIMASKDIGSILSHTVNTMSAVVHKVKSWMNFDWW